MRKNYRQLYFLHVDTFTPKFVKKYCNVAEIVTTAMKDYAADVRGGRFPEAQHCYNMIAGEEEKFLTLIKGYSGTLETRNL